MNAPHVVPRISRRGDSLGTENAFVVLAEVNDLVRQGRDIVSFCIGQPDFRTEAEIETWKRKDPIARLRGQLEAQGAMTDADWQAMNKEVSATIGDAVAFAEASPFPAPEQALEDMYAA